MKTNLEKFLERNDNTLAKYAIARTNLISGKQLLKLELPSWDIRTTRKGYYLAINNKLGTCIKITLEKIEKNIDILYYDYVYYTLLIEKSYHENI